MARHQEYLGFAVRKQHQKSKNSKKKKKVKKGKKVFLQKQKEETLIRNHQNANCEVGTSPGSDSQKKPKVGIYSLLKSCRKNGGERGETCNPRIQKFQHKSGAKSLLCRLSMIVREID